jgi:hypothetical protein
LAGAVDSLSGCSAVSLSPLAVVSYLKLGNVWRRIGPDELARLIKPGAKSHAAPYSLEPFIRTKSVFVHVPKTGGQSICRALYGNLGMGHLSVRDYRALFRRGALNQMFKFAFVRNPYDRVHSAYHFLRLGGVDREDAEFGERVLSRYQTFEKFVLEGLEQEEVARFWHFRPQTHFITSDHGVVDSLDFVGCYENFERDFGYVRRRLRSNARPLHVNRTPGKGDYRRDYTYEMADVVAHRYAAAFDLFGYDFDGPRKPPKLGIVGAVDAAGLFSDALRIGGKRSDPR